jgi:hypothetical protein
MKLNSSWISPTVLRRFGRLALSGIALVGLVSGQGTTLPFDWSTRPKDAGQSVPAPTLQLSSAQQVTIKIINVNDIFYSYGMSCTSAAKDSQLSAAVALLGQLEANAAGCDADAATVAKAVSDYLQTPANCGSNCTSVSLADTQKQLVDYRQQIDGVLACTSLSTASRGMLTNLRAQVQKLLDKDHVVAFQASISPDYDYACTISEYYNQQPTKNGTLALSIKPTNTIITLSLGPLFSAIRNRTYSSVTVPNADSTGSSTVLGVQGNSFSTAIAALVNIRVPIPSLAHDKLGVDLAAGPVVRLNSKSGTSSAGFFAGVSLRFYRYIFITPGIHIGEFADFPQGFNRVGQPLPPNFPTPTAVTRTTAKFGIAISFQTKDFSALGKSTATATAPSAGAATPSPAASGSSPTAAAGTVTLAATAGASTQSDLGTLGTTAIGKTLNLKNGSAGALSLTFSLRDPNKQVVLPKPNPCESMAAGGTCALALTLKPGPGNPPATLIIGMPDGTQQAVTLTWTKQN